MTARRRNRELAGRQLDDERALADPVLPTRGAARRPGQRPVRLPGEPRVTPRDRTARPPGADDRLRLVEPDRHVGPQAEDQLPRDPRLPLRRRHEVAVEIDAVSVRASARGEAVRIELMDEPEIGTRPRAREQPRDLDPLALVAVDAADDEDARPVATDVHCLDRPPLVRAPELLRRRGEQRSGDQRAQHHKAIVGRARTELRGHVRDRPDLPRSAEPREDELICVRPADDRPAAVRRPRCAGGSSSRADASRSTTAPVSTSTTRMAPSRAAYASRWPAPRSHTGARSAASASSRRSPLPSPPTTRSCPREKYAMPRVGFRAAPARSRTSGRASDQRTVPSGVSATNSFARAATT